MPNDVQEIAAIREVPIGDAFVSLPTTGRMDTALDHANDDRPRAWLGRVLVSVSAVDRELTDHPAARVAICSGRHDIPSSDRRPLAVNAVLTKPVPIRLDTRHRLGECVAVSDNIDTVLAEIAAAAVA